MNTIEILLVIAIICFITYFILSRKARHYVLANSSRYAAIQKLNQQVSFYDMDTAYVHKDRLNSKKQFDEYDYQKKGIDYFEENYDAYKRLLQMLNMNRNHWKKYNTLLEKEPYIAKEQTKGSSISYMLIRRVEQSLCASLLLDAPVLDATLDFRIRYTSPKGRNDYLDHRVYDASAIHQFLTLVDKKDLHVSFAEKQRRLMTPSVRYNILTRDGHKCLICGRSAEHGVVLHVDHIKPVSKGGLTEENNLRTLCADCNLGKSAKYDANGLN